jgi:DNA replication protein DnaC
MPPAKRASTGAAHAAASQPDAPRRTIAGGIRYLRREKEEAMTPRHALKDNLIDLRLQSMSEHLGTIMEHAAQHNLDLLTTLSRRADMELEQRFHNAIARRWRQSKLADKLTIAQFDCSHHKSSQEQKTRIRNLLNLDFARAHLDVILIGNPGAGQTFLAKGRAYAACNANIKVLFTTVIDMINHLIAAEADRSLLKKLQYSQAPELLVCDELGYVSLGQQGSHLFFQVISGRHHLKSTVITTNLPFADWGKVFDSTPVATAIADRLVYNSEVLILGGSSYRRKLT